MLINSPESKGFLSIPFTHNSFSKFFAESPVASHGEIHIPSGQGVVVSIPLKWEGLTYWDESQHAFVLEKGNVLLLVGTASDDIRLTDTIEVL